MSRSASRRPSRCSGSSSSLASVSAMSAGQLHISSSVSMSGNEQWNATGSPHNISSDSSCCTAPAAYFQPGSSSSASPSSSNGRKHMRSASSAHSLSAILNDYTNDKLNLDAQLDEIVPQEIYDKSLKRNRKKSRGSAQQFYSTLRADAIVSSIKKFSEASRQHLPEECHQKAVSACERSTSLCQDITNRISPSTAANDSNASVSSRKSTSRQAGNLSPANPGLLLFVAAMCCVVLYGNLNSSPTPLSDSDARYERMLATRGSTLRSSATSAHRSLQQMQTPNANHASNGGPTDINALLESQYRAQEEMHHSASVLAASNAAAASAGSSSSPSFPIASDAQQAQHLPSPGGGMAHHDNHPSRHQPSHHSAHHQGQYAQQPQPHGPQVLISEPTYYPDTDYSGAAATATLGRSWLGAGICWLSVLASLVGTLAALA